MPGLWQAGLRENYPGSAHSQAQSILLRWIDVDSAAQSLSAVLDQTWDLDYPAAKALMPEAGEAVMSVLERLGPLGDIGHVMVTKLAPHDSSAAHADEGMYSELYDRFHVCLAGGAGNTFTCGHETFRPAPGEIFWFNHKIEHAVHNDCDQERVHLIVDVMAPEFTRLRGIYYQEERVSMIWEEAAPLLEQHYHEIAHYQDIPLDPDRDAYLTMEATDRLRCYTMRDAGKLVGYVVFLFGSLHYKSSRQARQDVLFVRPDHRIGMAGMRLIRFAEKRLRADGVQVVYHHAKIRATKVGKVLEAMGYELVDGLYAKRLDMKAG